MKTWIRFFSAGSSARAAASMSSLRARARPQITGPRTSVAIFFNSWDPGSPLSITLDESRMGGPEPATLPGIFEGLQGARVGGRRVITMPPGDAFGDEGMPTLGLPAATDVVVVVDVLGAY